MQNLVKLFEKNKTKSFLSIKLRKTALDIEITAKNNFFTGAQIKQIIDIVNSAHSKYGNMYFSRDLINLNGRLDHPHRSN